MFVVVNFTFCFLIIIKNVFGENDENKILSRNEERCSNEFFRPSCSFSEVIIVKKALYGRMNIGRCLTEKETQAYGSQSSNQNFYGCFKNILSYLNEKCALKNSCDVRIGELETLFVDVCLPGLKLHLNVTYSCIKVIHLDDRCEMSASNDLKYLDPSQISTSKCGSGRKPFIIEAPRRQNIKMTLELFHQLKKNKDEMEENEVMCDRVLGTIKYDTKDNVTICSNGFAKDKESVVKDHFISSSDLVYVSLTQKIPKQIMFLIKIEAIGCQDIIQPEDTWLQRNGDEMVIGCFMTKQKWYLRCQDQSWTGVIGNCSIDYKLPDINLSQQEVAEGIGSETQILMIVLICGVGIVLCSLVVCVGAVCMRKYSVKKLPTTTTSMYNKQQPTYYLNDQPILNNFNETTTATSVNENNNMTDENKYFILENE